LVGKYDIEFIEVDALITDPITKFGSTSTSAMLALGTLTSLRMEGAEGFCGMAIDRGG
jgi:hypothetical protein